VAAKPVLGLPEVRPSLLDHLSVATRRGSSSTCATPESDHSIIAQVHAMNSRPDIDDEDDEVIEDEDFDEDGESDNDEDDLDDEDSDEEETWQVCVS
jgi:hypothetical protein